MIWAKESKSSKQETVGLIWKSSPEKFPFVVLWNLRRGFCNWIIFVANGRLNFQWNSLLRSCAIDNPTEFVLSSNKWSSFSVFFPVTLLLTPWMWLAVEFYHSVLSERRALTGLYVVAFYWLQLYSAFKHIAGDFLLLCDEICIVNNYSLVWLTYVKQCLLFGSKVYYFTTT